MDDITAAVSGRRAGLALSLATAVVVLAVYWPSLSYEFTNHDEEDYIVNNLALRRSGLGGIWHIVSRPIPRSHGDYLPATILSYWLDYRFWQLDPKGYHLSNVLLHAVNAGLICLLLIRLTNRPAVGLLAACLFGLHPMNTEAVTWVAERKTVLSMFFMLVSFHAFCRYQDRPRGRRWYAVSLVLYLLACLSKTTVVIYPLLLLAEQLYLRRRGLTAALVRAAPFIVLAVLCGVGRVLGHHYTDQLVSHPFDSFYIQIVNIAGIFSFYLAKLAWPAGLNCSYPVHLASSPLAVSVILGALALAAMVAVAWWSRRRAPLVGFFVVWYLAGWLPHAQIIPIPPGLRADRYVYYSCTGVAVLLAMGLLWLAGRLAGRRRWLRVVLTVLPAVGLCAGAASATFLRNPVWANSNALWTDALSKAPDSAFAHNNFGQYLARAGQLERAGEHFVQAIRLMPRDADLYCNLGNTLLYRGRIDQAIDSYSEALRLKPDHPGGHFGLGLALAERGKLDQAIAHYRRALDVRPDQANAHHHLANALVRRGKYQAAAVHYARALQINPDHLGAMNNLAWLLATCSDDDVRNGPEALRVAHSLVRKVGEDDAQALDTLAAAYAETGQFQEAAETQRQAVELASPQVKQDFVDRLDLYRASRPTRSTDPGEAGPAASRPAQSNMRS